ncbi:MAG: hypothetical protein AAGB03_10515 [Pseudomonadota bacterium]
MSSADLPLRPGLAAPERERVATGPTKKPRGGPVLMGDIHGAWGGTPMLLHLWALWEQDRDDD